MRIPLRNGTAWQAERAGQGWQAWWLELVVVAALVVVPAVCLSRAWPAPQDLDPLLAAVPALAGVGAATARRPAAYGAASLAIALVVAVSAHDALAAASLAAVAVTAILAIAATARSGPRPQRLANVVSVAEAAQRAVLRPLPGTLGPLSLSVVYLAAAADAKVGGDLYDVARTPHGIRLIIGDVRGKGLGAVEAAADVLGMYREVAYEVHTLAELARRLDAGLSRRWGEHEEFVTALLAEIDPGAGRLTIYNCGHPPPILISGGAISVLEVPAPAPPLGLLTLGDSSGAGRTLPFKPNDQLLLYTDGVTEARDSRREFYPLEGRIAVLGAGAEANGSLLELLREDLLSHVGSPLDDDAALLLVRAPAAWPGPPRAGAV